MRSAVLDGLELLDGDRLRPQNSPLRQGGAGGTGQQGVGPGRQPQGTRRSPNDVEVECKYQLEPELLVIVLLALVQNGNLTLSLAGKKLDAGNLSEASRLGIDSLVQFKHIERPKGLPLAELVALFDLLGLAEGLIRNPDTHEEAVKQLRAHGPTT